VKKLLPLVVTALLLVFPGAVFAADESCSEDTVCECTDSDGTTISLPDDSIFDGNACSEKCAEMSSASYALYCGDEATPMESEDVPSGEAKATTKEAEMPSVPALNVPIPGLDLSGSVQVDDQGNIKTNMIGLYVNAVFSYGITLASIFGVLMFTIAGFQYMTAGGDKGAVSKAKARMTNTIFGIVILMATYCIAFLIDPRTTYFNSLTLKNVAEITLDEDTSGSEGGDSSGSTGGTGTWRNLSEPYRTIVEQAKEKVTCTIPDLISSPTGNLPNQGRHHWYDRGINGNYLAIKALDWAAPWGDEIYAPFEGTVTYKQQTDTSNKCGNRIYLRSADGNASITICHAKDFVATGGTFEKSRTVEKGDVFGRLGGLCCAGQDSAYEVTKCDVQGTMCTDPTKEESCSCQRITEAGNTTGPHVHVTFDNMPAGMMLACLE